MRHVLRNIDTFSPDMPEEVFYIPEQGHTLACLLRDALFEENATFAACAVLHPQDRHLTVHIDHPTNCGECLLDALRAMHLKVSQMKRTVDNYRIHADLNSVESMECDK